MGSINCIFSKDVGLLQAILPKKDFVINEFQMKILRILILWFTRILRYFGMRTSVMMHGLKNQHTKIRDFSIKKWPLAINNRGLSTTFPLNDKSLHIHFLGFNVFNSVTEGEKSNTTAAVNIASHFPNHKSIRLKFLEFTLTINA